MARLVCSDSPEGNRFCSATCICKKSAKKERERENKVDIRRLQRADPTETGKSELESMIISSKLNAGRE